MKTISLIFIECIALLGASLWFSACDQPSTSLKEPLDKKPVWEARILQGEAPFLPNLMAVTPISNDVVMIGYTENNQLMYAGLNVNSGMQVWKSLPTQLPNHLIPLRHMFASGDRVYFYAPENEYDAAGNPTRTKTPFFAYNVATGERVFKKVYPRIFGFYPSLLRSDGELFVSLESSSTDSGGNSVRPKFWFSSYPDFDTQLEFTVPLKNNFTYADGTNAKGWISDFQLIHDATDVFLLYLMREPQVDAAPNISSANSINHINCYNLTRGEWLYLKKPSPTGGWIVAVDGEHIFCAQPGALDDDSAGLRCFNWKTGELVWFLSERDINPNAQISLAYAAYDPDAKMIVTNEIGFVYGIDAVSGRVKWKSTGIVSETSEILIHRGVAYSIGAYVHGIDVLTGEHLMKASCPSQGRTVDGQKASGFFGPIGMYVRADGTPLIIAQNNVFAYAFEGVR